ncbi:MAG: hypothetical protein EXR60_00310 [Dehalococcoidia bacterium]|nr:hypothetical protein [Dehalococcoidia bacterium]
MPTPANRDLDLYLTQLDSELKRFPAAVATEFGRVSTQVRARLSPLDFRSWASEGAALAGHSFRSWEAAAEYYRASLPLVEQLELRDLLRWARLGKQIAQDSSAVSAAYFRASPGTLGQINPMQLDEWVSLGRRLYKGTWRSGSLACRFFEASPRLFKDLSLEEAARFVTFLEELSFRSYDIATECLTLAEEVFPAIESEDRAAFLSLALMIVEANWVDAKPYFEVGPRVVSRVDKGQRGRFFSLGRHTAELSARQALSFIVDGSRVLGEVDSPLHGRILELYADLLEQSPPSALEFIKSTPKVLEKVSAKDLEAWYREGVRILAENPEGGEAYFRLESSRGEQVLETLSSTVELDRVKEVLRLYCKGLTGKNVQLLPTQSLTDKGIGWVSQERPSTEGTAVFLPPAVERYSTKAENFGWYKVMSTHQAAHLEFGSFDFAFDRPASLFENLRPALAEAAGQAQRQPLTPLERFFDLFEDRRLALDLFTIAEDTRIDALVKREYGGIRRPYQRVQRDEIEQRPAIEEKPLREAFVEILVRASLHAGARLLVPKAIRTLVLAARRVLRDLQGETGRVEDSTEATILLYALAAQVPNVPAAPDEWEEMDLDQPDKQGEQMDLSMEAMSQLGESASQQVGSTQEQQPYESPEQVEFRGDFKPELVQLLARLREGAQQEGQEQMQGLTPEALQALAEKSAEIEISQMSEGEVERSAGLFVSNIMDEMAQQKPLFPLPHQPRRKRSQEEDDGQPLDIHDPQTFLYDEWDFRAGDYRPRWCAVREKVVEEGSVEFYDRTLESHAILAAQVRRQFELISPEVFRKIKRLPDGEEFDLDAVIDSIIMRRVGQSPSEKVYWRRNKVERDVAVVFLLDMSASTAEAVEERRKESQDWDFPDDPRQYLEWLKARRAEESRRQYKRIIDIEKESMVLLVRALETTGDTYGIYGFSGYGRENVEFFVIKDINEGFNDRVKRRIDKVVPMHATRMGPAIRHATAKLAAQDAKTKILFLISDGRPQDHGYSRDGMEKEYAIHDTKMALTEARRKNVVPFCLTVDKAGHDYLKTMCKDMAYEIVADIDSLPKRLPFLYRRLTQ